MPELCLAYFVCVLFLAYFVQNGQNMLEITTEALKRRA